MSDEDKEGDKGFNLSNDESFKQLQSVVKTLVQTSKTLADGQTTMQQSFNTMLTDGIPHKKTEEPAPKVEEEDLNEMSQSQLVGHMLSEVGKLVDTKVGTVNERLENVATNIGSTLTKEHLTKFMETHPDLLDISEDVKAIMQDNSSIGINRAYMIAKSELSNERTLELEDKYKDTDDKGQKKSTPFGGLTPTSSDYTKDGTDEENLSTSEAQEVAWEEAVGEFPAIADAG